MSAGANLILLRAPAIIPTYAPQVLDWADAAGGNPGVDALVALTIFIRTAENDGWADKIVFPFCSPLASGHLISLTDPTVTLNQVGFMTHTPGYGLEIEYEDGGTTDEADDSAGGWLETTMNADTAPWWDKDNWAFSAWSQTGRPDDAACGAHVPLNRFGMATRTSNARMQWWTGGTNTDTLNTVKSQGAAGVSRTSPTGGFMFYPKESVDPKGVTQDWLFPSMALPAAKFTWFRFINAYSRNQHAFALMGADFTLDMQRSFDAAGRLCLYQMGTLKPYPVPRVYGANHFNITEPAAFPTRMIRIAPVPASDAIQKDTYRWGPVTDVHGSMDASVIDSTDTRVKFWPHIWNDRWHDGDHRDNGPDFRANVAAGWQCRHAFSTYDKAIISSLVKQAYVLGIAARNDTRLTTLFENTTEEPAGQQVRPAGFGWLDIADLGGYDTSLWAPFVAEPDEAIRNLNLYSDVNISTGDVAHPAYFIANKETIYTTLYAGDATTENKICLHKFRITDIPALYAARRGGAWFDDETRDGRLGYLARKMQKGAEQIALATGFPFCCSTNAKDDSINSGWDATTCAWSMGLQNFLTSIVTRGAAVNWQESMDAQLALFGPAIDGSKLFMAAVLGAEDLETPIVRVQYSFAKMIEYNIRSTQINAGYGHQGGELFWPQNQIIATLNGLPRDDNTEPVVPPPPPPQVIATQAEATSWTSRISARGEPLLGQALAAANWATAISYGVGAYASESRLTYRCLTAHTSGVFATDLEANKWALDHVARATNILIYRMKASGAHAALYEYGTGAGGTQISSLEGIKGTLVASDWSIPTGTVTWQQWYGFSSSNGARIQLNKANYSALAGITTKNFGLGFALTTNLVGVSVEMGAYDPITDYQVTLRGSGGITGQARLGGTAQSFGDANAVGFSYAAKRAISGDVNAGTYCSSNKVYPTTGVPDGLPASKLVLLAGGLTGNTASANRMCLWFIGALTSAQMLLTRDAMAEYFLNMEIADDIEVPIVSAGLNAFGKTTINSVTPANLRVTRFTVPPGSPTTGSITYNAFPLTDCFTRQKPSTNDSTFVFPRSGRFYQFVWVNVGERNTAAGPITGMPRRRWNDSNGTSGSPTYPPVTIDGITCAPVYTTKRMARYASLAIVAKHAGYTDRAEASDPRTWGVLDYVEAGGMLAANFQTQDYWEANKVARFTESIDSKWCARDIVMPDRYFLYENTAFVGFKGIMLDFEPDDDPNGPAWTTSTVYAIGDPVTVSNAAYTCLVAHTSGTFATDLAAAKWVAATSLTVEFLVRAGEICAAKSLDLIYTPHPLETTTGFNDGFNEVTCPAIMQSASIPWYSIDARHNDGRGYSITDSLDKQVGLATAPMVGSTTYNPPSLVDGASASVAVTVPGTVNGQEVYVPSFTASLSPSASTALAVTVSAAATAANTVTVTFTNNTGFTQDIGSGTLKAYAKGAQAITWSKVMMTVQVGVNAGQMSEADAYLVRAWMLAKGITRITLGESGAARGGDITQPAQRIRAIILGLPLS